MALNQLRQRDVTKLLQAVPALLGLPAARAMVDYDSEADVLYISFERPQKATDSDMRDDGTIIHRRGKKVVGVTVLDASTR